MSEYFDRHWTRRVHVPGSLSQAFAIARRLVPARRTAVAVLTWVLGMVPPLAAQRSPPFADKTIPLEDGVDGRMEEWGFEKTGRRAYRFVTDDAKQIAYLLDAIELVVLP